eukprot:jgi/Mesvir1/28417/Mv15846-RA.1
MNERSPPSARAEEGWDDVFGSLVVVGSRIPLGVQVAPFPAFGDGDGNGGDGHGVGGPGQVPHGGGSAEDGRGGTRAEDATAGDLWDDEASSKDSEYGDYGVECSGPPYGCDCTCLAGGCRHGDQSGDQEGMECQRVHKEVQSGPDEQQSHARGAEEDPEGRATSRVAGSRGGVAFSTGGRAQMHSRVAWAAECGQCSSSPCVCAAATTPREVSLGGLYRGLLVGGGYHSVAGGVDEEWSEPHRVETAIWVLAASEPTASIRQGGMRNGASVPGCWEGWLWDEGAGEWEQVLAAQGELVEWVAVGPRKTVDEGEGKGTRAQGPRRVPWQSSVWGFAQGAAMTSEVDLCVLPVTPVETLQEEVMSWLFRRVWRTVAQELEPVLDAMTQQQQRQQQQQQQQLGEDERTASKAGGSQEPSMPPGATRVHLPRQMLRASWQAHGSDSSSPGEGPADGNDGGSNKGKEEVSLLAMTSPLSASKAGPKPSAIASATVASPATVPTTVAPSAVAPSAVASGKQSLPRRRGGRHGNIWDAAPLPNGQSSPGDIRDRSAVAMSKSKMDDDARDDDGIIVLASPPLDAATSPDDDVRAQGSLFAHGQEVIINSKDKSHTNSDIGSAASIKDMSTRQDNTANSKDSGSRKLGMGIGPPGPVLPFKFQVSPTSPPSRIVISPPTSPSAGRGTVLITVTGGGSPRTRLAGGGSPRTSSAGGSPGTSVVSGSPPSVSPPGSGALETQGSTPLRIAAISGSGEGSTPLDLAVGISDPWSERDVRPFSSGRISSSLSSQHPTLPRHSSQEATTEAIDPLKADMTEAAATGAQGNAAAAAPGSLARGSARSGRRISSVAADAPRGVASANVHGDVHQNNRQSMHQNMHQNQNQNKNKNENKNEMAVDNDQSMQNQNHNHGHHDDEGGTHTADGLATISSTAGKDASTSRQGPQDPGSPGSARQATGAPPEEIGGVLSPLRRVMSSPEEAILSSLVSAPAAGGGRVR